MLDKYFVYNVLAEGMYFLDKKSPIKFQFFGLSFAFLKMSKFLMWFLKAGVRICIDFAPFCNVLAKT